MAEQAVSYRTVSCDGPGCDKSVTFEMGNQQTGMPEETRKILSAEENAWMNSTLRKVITPDGRQLTYCNDVCEINAVAAGNHNKPEPKKVITMPGGAAQDMIRKAAQAAAVARQADKNLREGPGAPPPPPQIVP